MFTREREYMLDNNSHKWRPVARRAGERLSFFTL
jgi:hypothetical protein